MNIKTSKYVKVQLLYEWDRTLTVINSNSQYPKQNWPFNSP